VNKNVFFGIVLAVCYILPGPAVKATDNKIVATVNGTMITNDVLLAGINEKLPLISIHTRVSERRFDEIRKQVLNELIDNELLFQEAKRQDIRIDKALLSKQINMMKKAYPSETVFKQELKKTGSSYKQWVNKIKRHLLINQLLKQEVNNKINITDGDIQSYYEKNKYKFKIPEQLKLLHILISVPPGGMREGWQAGLQKADSVYQRIMAGEDFAAMAQKVSDDTSSSKKGGDIGWLHVGQLLPELDKVAVKLEIGQVSKPIRTIYGYHIIKVIGRKPAKQLSIDEVGKNNIEKRIYKSLYAQRKEELITKLRAAATIRIFEQ